MVTQWTDAALSRRLVLFNRLDLVRLDRFAQNSQSPPLNRQRDHLTTVLTEAAASADLAQLERLVALDIGLTFRRDACAVVALNGHAHVLRWMHAHRHEPFATGRMEVTPEHVAYVRRLGHVGVLEVLIEWFPECVTLRTLEEATSAGRVAVIELLLANKDTTAMKSAPTSTTATAAVAADVLTNSALIRHIGTFHERLSFDIDRLVQHYHVEPGQSIEDVVGLLPRMAIIQQDVTSLKAVYEASLLPTKRHLPMYSFASAMYDAASEDNVEIVKWLESRPGMPCRPDTLPMAAVLGDNEELLTFLLQRRPESAWSLAGTDVGIYEALSEVDLSYRLVALELTHAHGIGVITDAVASAAIRNGVIHSINFLIEQHPQLPHLNIRAMVPHVVRHGHVPILELLLEKYPEWQLTEAEVVDAVYDFDMWEYLWSLRDAHKSIQAGLRRGLAAHCHQPDIIGGLFDREENFGSLPEIDSEDLRIMLIGFLNELEDRTVLVDVFRFLLSRVAQMNSMWAIVTYGNLSGDHIAAIYQMLANRDPSLVPVFMKSERSSDSVFGILAKAYQWDLVVQLHPLATDDDAAAVLRNTSHASTQLYLIKAVKSYFNDQMLLQHLHPELSGWFIKQLVLSPDRSRTERRNYGELVKPDEISESLTVDEVRKVQQLGDPEVTALARHAMDRSTVGDVAGNGDVELLAFIFELVPEYRDVEQSDIARYILYQAIDGRHKGVTEWIVRTCSTYDVTDDCGIEWLMTKGLTPPIALLRDVLEMIPEHQGVQRLLDISMALVLSEQRRIELQPESAIESSSGERTKLPRDERFRRVVEICSPNALNLSLKYAWESSK